MDSQSVTLDDLVRAVRKYKPSTLLTHLATASASRPATNVTSQDWDGVSPWAISEIAKFSAVYSNEWVNDRAFGSFEIKRMCHYVHNSERIQTDETSETFAKRSLLRLGFEQFPYQRDLVASAARAVAILHFTPLRHKKFASAGMMTNYPFGIPIEKAAYGALLLWGASTLKNGLISWNEFQRDDLAKLFEELKLQEFRALARSLAIPIKEFRNEITNVDRPDPETTRLLTNPLFRTPLLEINHDLFIAPERANLLRAVGLDAVLGRLHDARPEKFRQVGPIFQQYVTDLALQTVNANVIPEFKYRDAKDIRDTIDLFLVLPNLLMLIEVKSRRPTGKLLVGEVDVDSAYEPEFRIATDQINRTVRDFAIIASKNGDLPTKLPMVGVVITSERYHFSNSELFSRQQENHIPIVRMSVDEFEQMVQMDGGFIADRVSQIVSDPDKSRWDLSISFGELLDIETRNPLIVEAWQKVVSLTGSNSLVTPKL